MSNIKDFTGLPLEELVCNPIIAAAEGQSELCSVYLDYLFKLAAKTMPDSEREAAVKSRVVNFKFSKAVVDDETGETKTTPVEVTAPLLSLVPVPAFTMDEVTVNFDMEVKESSVQETSVDTESSVLSNHSAWGFSSNIAGKVAPKKENMRSTDTSAKYEIHAKATQQPSKEGMSKLAELFASSVEPAESEDE